MLLRRAIVIYCFAGQNIGVLPSNKLNLVSFPRNARRFSLNRNWTRFEILIQPKVPKSTKTDQN